MVPRPPRPGAGKPVKNPVPPPAVANVPPASLPLFWMFNSRGALPKPVAPRSAKTAASKMRSALAGIANANIAVVTSKTLFIRTPMLRGERFLISQFLRQKILLARRQILNGYFLDKQHNIYVYHLSGEGR